MKNVLPESDSERGDILLATCLLDYFPNSLAAVARHSARSNEKHNPGQPPHWARDKSTDHRNKIMRHLVDAGGFDADGNRHSVAIAWRGLALLEDELIAEGATPGRNAVGSPGVDIPPESPCDDELSVDWNAFFPTRAQLDAGRPVESPYLASFSPNADIPKSHRTVASAEDLARYGIGDVPRSTHPLQHVEIQDHDSRLAGAEDRL